MKKILFILFFIHLFVQPSYALNISGKYELVGNLDDLRGVKHIELKEFFNFSCGHCYKFLTTAQRLEKKYKGKLTHVSMPIFWGEQTPYPAMAYFIGKEKGKGEQAKKEIFDSRFKMNIDIFDYRMISFIASSLGYGEEFEKRSQSAAMKSKIDAVQKEANKYGVNQTPTIILNGVIKVNPGMTDGDTDKMTDNIDRIIEDILQ